MAVATVRQRVLSGITASYYFIYAPEGCRHGTHTNGTAYIRGTYSRVHTQTPTNTNKQLLLPQGCKQRLSGPLEESGFKKRKLSISCSQAGAGAFLMRLPDVSVKGSIIDSTDYRTIVQRRLGLYLTCLAVPLDESEARGAVVTQHQRLGDAAINAARVPKCLCSLGMA